MIVLNLSCGQEHLFEGWFASSEAFEAQREGGLLSCPVCGSSAVSRRPSAPYVNTRTALSTSASSARGKARDLPIDADALAMAVASLRRMGRESEDVGDRFADEARRIHHGESEARNIRGRATQDDVSELIDEGIAVLPLPADDEVH